jgi:hypothetical protein
MDVQGAKLCRLQHGDVVLRAGRYPHGSRWRHDVGDPALAGLRGRDLHDAGGAVRQLRTGVSVRLKVGVSRHAAGAHAHRALLAGGVAVYVAEWR